RRDSALLCYRPVSVTHTHTHTYTHTHTHTHTHTLFFSCLHRPPFFVISAYLMVVLCLWMWEEMGAALRLCVCRLPSLIWAHIYMPTDLHIMWICLASKASLSP